LPSGPRDFSEGHETHELLLQLEDGILCTSRRSGIYKVRQTRCGKQPDEESRGVFAGGEAGVDLAGISEHLGLP
jgi:hypothetical protein